MSEDYRKHLGLPAVIRRDFDRISRMVEQENSDLDGHTSIGQEAINSDRRVNRIVLYIDDLDRCPEQLVVEVLQAVHLLLAFPLFVVVVAVDARRVSASLEQRFPGLLTSGSNGQAAAIESIAAAHATPSDYLEKIFQIPFWLRHPSEESVKRMVRSLVREGVVAAAPSASGKNPVTSPEQSTARKQATLFKKRQHDPNASLLDVPPAELEYIEQLAPLLDRSPRALKRFVNVYRLVKASLPPEEQDTFLEEDGPLATPFRIVLLLLAIVNGLPDVSDAMFDSLTSGAPQANLGAILAEGPNECETMRAQRQRLTEWLDAHVGASCKDVDPALTVAWLPRVGRYSYHFHRP